VALALTLRLVLALTYESYWGVDGGASLLTVNAVLGDEPTGAGFPKPPLAPGWLLAPFVLLWGPDVGYKVWSAVFALCPLLPVYLLTRQYVGQWSALFATAFAAIDITWAELFVTGAHPLVAFALLGLACWSMGELAERFSLKSAIILTFSIGLIPWVNQTTAGLALIVLPVYWLALAYFIFVRGHRLQVDFGGQPQRFFWDTLPPIIIGGAIALGALPWYLQTLPGSAILTYQGPKLYWAWDWSTFQAFCIALPLGVFVVWKAEDYRLKTLGVVLLVLGFLVNWMSYDEVLINPPYRARYLMAVAVYPLITWVVFRYWWERVPPKLAYVAMAGVFLYISIGFVYVVRLQNQYSEMVTPATARALEHLRSNDPEAGVATNSFTLSLWVAGLNKVQAPFAFTAPPPPAYVQDDADLRCLLNWVDGCVPGHAAQRLGIGYLLIEERFPYYNDRAPGNYLAPPDQWARTAQAPWLAIAYSEGSTRLWKISDYGRSASTPGS
jgi:hypothetical protein